jgi:hypothetical protein
MGDLDFLKTAALPIMRKAAHFGVKSEPRYKPAAWDRRVSVLILDLIYPYNFHSGFKNSPYYWVRRVLFIVTKTGLYGNPQ